MCDTFNPLKLTKFAKDLDDGDVLALVVRERAGGRADEATPAAPA